MASVTVKDINPKAVGAFGVIDNNKERVTELVAIGPDHPADEAGELTCYICGDSRHAVVYLGNNWYICAQCMFNGVRQGYFRLVHQGQQDETHEAFVSPDKPVFHDDGTTEIDGIKVAWE